MAGPLPYWHRSRLLDFAALRNIKEQATSDPNKIEELKHTLLHDIINKKNSGSYPVAGSIEKKLSDLIKKKAFNSYLKAEAILEYSKIDAEMWRRFDDNTIDFDSLLRLSQKIYEEIFSELLGSNEVRILRK